jgi:hypothetical protein
LSRTKSGTRNTNTIYENLWTLSLDNIWNIRHLSCRWSPVKQHHPLETHEFKSL